VPSTRPSLAAYLDELRRLIDDALARALPAETAPPLIVEAMRYALVGGGKRLRPCLTLATAEAVAAADGGEQADARWLALPGACAVEMVHAYSLVHDDLPSMDNDSIRRGRPTTHVVYGEGVAILAGDALLTEAFATLARSPSPALPAGMPEAPPARRLQSLAILAFAAGAPGMVGGQTIDLAAAGRVRDRSVAPFDPTALEDMHARKTGALIRAAAALGAIAAGAPGAAVGAVDEYARELGLAFQIIDDVLDVEGSKEALGKTAGKDAAAGKPTYPALYGIEESRRLAALSVERAKTALAGAGLAGRLADIADWSLERRR
jgi:geranylgeranyl pyrophosphate synthase